MPPSSSHHQSHQYKGQVEPIKQLTAQNRPSKEAGLDFVITSYAYGQGKHRLRLAGEELIAGSLSLKEPPYRHTVRAANEPVKEEVDHHSQYKRICEVGDPIATGREDVDYRLQGHDKCYANGGANSTCAERTCYDEKMDSEFTPTTAMGDFLLKGDNQSANWGQNGTCAPMKLSEVGASIINMPSLKQGQAFSDISPLQGSGYKHHHRSSAQQASWQSPGSGQASLGPGQRLGSGWRRNAHSATMYTRYRSPEFALMYSDLESAGAAAASCVWASNTDGRLRKIKCVFCS